MAHFVIRSVCDFPFDHVRKRGNALGNYFAMLPGPQLSAQHPQKMHVSSHQHSVGPKFMSLAYFLSCQHSRVYFFHLKNAGTL